MNFGKNLLKYANRMNISVQKELAEKLKESEKTISSYTTGRSYPTYKKLVKLCNLLKCDPNTLMEGDFETTITNITPKLNSEDQYIIDHYKALTPHDKEIVDHIFNMKPENPTIIYRFPVYEQQAAAGAGKHGREGKYYMKDLQITNLSDNAVFGVEISGNSMEKKNNADSGIKDNATVLLNPNFDELDLEGRVVVFKINSTNEVLCKRYFKEENTVGFISDNDECSEFDKHLAVGEYTIIGEVVNIINP